MAYAILYIYSTYGIAFNENTMITLTTNSNTATYAYVSFLPYYFFSFPNIDMKCE
jgi:hypothetical protein